MSTELVGAPRTLQSLTMDDAVAFYALAGKYTDNCLGDDYGYYAALYDVATLVVVNPRAVPFEGISSLDAHQLNDVQKWGLFHESASRQIPEAHVTPKNNEQWLGAQRLLYTHVSRRRSRDRLAFSLASLAAGQLILRPFGAQTT